MTTMRAAVILSLLMLAAAGPVRAAGAVQLEEVLRAAVARTRSEQIRVAMAERQLELIEAQGRLKLELRPSLGMFAFSNPALLAANLGSSLLLQRWSAPSPWLKTSARYDVLAAEIAAARERLRVEVEAAQAFFDLWEKQQVVGLIRQAAGEQARQALDVAALVKTGRATALDAGTWELQRLDLRERLVQAEDARTQAAIRLELLMGRDRPEGELLVEAGDWSQPAGASEIPLVDALLSRALAERRDTRLLDERLRELAGQHAQPGGIRFESMNLGYAFLSDTRGGQGVSGRGILLGGNTGRGDLGLSIPLRKTGEREAGAALLEARARLLQWELRRTEEELRAQLATLRSQAVSSRERMKIAEERQELAARQARMVEARVEGGLANRLDLVNAAEALLRARTEAVRARGTHRASLVVLGVVSGASGEPEGAEEDLAGR